MTSLTLGSSIEQFADRMFLPSSRIAPPPALSSPATKVASGSGRTPDALLTTGALDDGPNCLAAHDDEIPKRLHRRLARSLQPKLYAVRLQDIGANLLEGFLLELLGLRGDARRHLVLRVSR